MHQFHSILFVALWPAFCAVPTLHAQSGSDLAEVHVAETPGEAEIPDGFASAQFIPADITLYLHVSGAATLRRDLGELTIADWFKEAFIKGEAGRVWSQAAGVADLDPAALFDALLGERFTFVLRQDSSPEAQKKPAAQWALLTEVEAGRAAKVLATFKPVALGPKSGMAMLELPEHELILARRGQLLLIGPKSEKQLFIEVQRTLAGDPPAGGSLSSSIDQLRRRQFPARVSNDAGQRAEGPTISVFMRHALPLGGSSIATVEFRSIAGAAKEQTFSDGAWVARGPAAVPEEFIIRHFGSFDVSPFTQSMPRAQIDVSILDAFDENQSLVFIEPVDAGPGQLELFIQAMTGERLLSPSMRANAGPRRMFVMAGPAVSAEDSASISMPSAAVCYEFQDAMDAAADFDQHMHAFSRRVEPMVSKLNAQLCRAEASDLACPQDERDGNEPPDNDHKAISLSWTTAAGPHGGWYIVASNPDHLTEVASALSRPSFVERFVKGDDQPAIAETKLGRKCEVASFSGHLHSAGQVNGRGFAQVLLNLRDTLPLLVGGEKTDGELTDSIQNLSDLVAGLERVRWKLSRPDEQKMDLEIRIRLAR